MKKKSISQLCLGDLMKMLREISGFTYEKLSELLDKDVKTIRRWVKEENYPQMTEAEFLFRFKKAFDEAKKEKYSSEDSVLEKELEAQLKSMQFDLREAVFQREPECDYLILLLLQNAYKNLPKESKEQQETTALTGRKAVEEQYDFEKRLSGKIQRIDMITYGSSFWFLMPKPRQLFQNLLNSNVPIRVLCVDEKSNSARYAAESYYYDLDPELRLENFANANRVAELFDKKYKNFEKRKTTAYLPFSMMLVETENEQDSTIQIVYYSFFDMQDDSTRNANRRCAYIKKSVDSENYHFYRKQFEILWTQEEKGKFTDGISAPAIQGWEGSLKEIYEDSFEKNIADALWKYVGKVDMDGNARYGWWRYPGRYNMVGTWSTAVGLCISVYTNCMKEEYWRHRKEILDFLWESRRENGGFCSDNQMFESLEATCIVAKTFLMEREFERARQAFQDLQMLWETYGDTDYINGIPVTILCYVLECFVLFEENEERLKEIEQKILKKAVGMEEVEFWTESSNKNIGSVTNSSRAVRALLLSAAARGAKEEMVLQLEKCGKWIYESDWLDSEEDIHRERLINGQLVKDHISFCQYAIPNCVMALLKLGYNKYDTKIVCEMEKMLSHKVDGLWCFPRNSRNYQMWTTYEALQCIDEYKKSGNIMS